MNGQCKNDDVIDSSGAPQVKNCTYAKSRVQCFETVPDKNREYSKQLDQELLKFGLSILYVFFAHFLSTLSIIIAQERLPDKTRYRPLPDLILENVPYIPWAYKVTEGIIYLGVFSVITICLFHKNRFTVLRRSLCLLASSYLLRAMCVVMTSLPMPQQNYNCDRTNYVNNWERLHHAFFVYIEMGMKVTGLKTCGDYMFSGHTVIITLLIYTINYYTPHRWILLHFVVWIVGLIGIAFIFLNHGHYSIDVIIAFVISSRSFLYYQSISDNMSLLTKNRKMLRQWFPILYFMESNCPGNVQNEYNYPLPSLRRIKRFLKCRHILECIRFKLNIMRVYYGTIPRKIESQI